MNARQKKRTHKAHTREEEVVDAAVDLAREAEFLAALKHPNVIWIRGTIGAPGHPKFSLVFDRLYDTPGVQMTKWRAERKRHRGKFKGLIGKNQAIRPARRTTRKDANKPIRC